MGAAMNLNAVSLFAGVGGIDLALHNAGMPTVAAVEIDNAAREACRNFSGWSKAAERVK